MTPDLLMLDWLLHQLPAEASAWLVAQRGRVHSGLSDRDFNLAFSLVPRHVGKADLDLDEHDLANAETTRPGWDPRGWSADQAGRLILLLAAAEHDGARFATRLRDLMVTADLSETITILRGLPLYPDPQAHLGLAQAGVRSGMRPVFEAVAHANPYAAEQFDEAAWNQLVVKALFIESTLMPIQGLDRRANAVLMRMLCDYAHERWAAGRAVSPELWRCVGPWADGPAREDLARVCALGNLDERAAAAAALAARVIA